MTEYSLKSRSPLVAKYFNYNLVTNVDRKSIWLLNIIIITMQNPNYIIIGISIVTEYTTLHVSGYGTVKFKNHLR